MVKSTGTLLLSAALSARQTVTSDMAFRGNLFDRPCHVFGDNLDKHVAFKIRASRDFWYPPGHPSIESFVIRLENCHATTAGEIATLTFKGTEGAALPGHLRVTRMNAGRLDTTLLDTDGSSLLESGVSRNKSQGEKVTGDSLELPFNAHVMTTPGVLRTKSMVLGDYEATATFELTYCQ